MNLTTLKIGLILLSLSVSFEIKSEIIQVKIFYDKDWRVCESNNAFYYRICDWNRIDQFFDGEFSDFFINGEKIVQGKYEQGKKNGEFIFWDGTGSVKIKGTFKNDIPDSLWIWYYPNNKIEFKITFNQDEFEILEINDENGNSVLNKKYNFCFKFQNDNSNSNFRIIGTIENSLKEGKWRIMKGLQEFGFDLYKNGQYIKTVYSNNDNGNLNLTRIINNTLFIPFSIYACEKLELVENLSDTEYPFSSRLTQWKPIESAAGIIGDSIILTIDEKPRYLGGIDGLNKTIAANMKLPRKFLENCKQFGYAYFEIVIDENGYVINKSIIRSPDPVINEIVLNSLSQLGCFKPAIKNGKPIKSKLTSRIKFETW